jgi:hypothetical protein
MGARTRCEAIFTSQGLKPNSSIIFLSIPPVSRYFNWLL